MSKRARNQSKESTVILLPWFGLPQEIVLYIHSFFCFADIGLLFKLIRVTRTYHLYLTEQLKELFFNFDHFYNDFQHNFPCTHHWKTVFGQRTIETNLPSVKHALHRYLEEHRETIYQSREALYPVLYLFRTLIILTKYKPVDIRDRWPLSLLDHHIPVNTTVKYIFHYDAENDKMLSLKDVKQYTLKRVKNMPSNYHTKCRLHLVVQSAEIGLKKKDLLLSLVRKPLSDYVHSIAYMTLGKKVKHGSLHNKTPIKHIVVNMKDEANTHLHIYANQLNGFRAKLFRSRYDNARLALIEYKVSYYPSEILKPALAFLK